MLCVRMLCVRMVCVRMVCVRPCVYVCFLFFIPPEYDFIYSTMIITVNGVSRHSNPRPPSKLAKIGKIGSKCQLLSVLVRVLVSSETHNDPFNRSRCTPEAGYAPPAPLKPKGGGHENGMLHFLNILKTMSINSRCLIQKKRDRRRILSHLLCTDQVQFDTFHREHRCKQAKHKQNPLICS